MTFVVTDSCVKCKYTTCVEVCPVDCFYEGELMLIINPDECIDCGVCEPECPIEAIKPESEEYINLIEYAKENSSIFPNITQIKDPLPNADFYKEETNKFETYIKKSQ